MAQVSYGTITLTDTHDIESIIIEYARNQNSQNAPTSGWGTTRPTWEEGYYIWQRTHTHMAGTPASSDVYGTAVCITGLKGATGQTGAAGRSLTATTTQYTTAASSATITESNMGSYTWNSNVPSYNSSTPAYWVRVTNTYSNPSSTEYVIYKDNGITDAMATANTAETHASAAATDAANAVAQASSTATALNNYKTANDAAVVALQERASHFWWDSEGAHVASGVSPMSKTNITEGNASTYGFNALMAPGSLSLRQKAVNLAQLATNALTFYIPPNSGTTQGPKAMEVGTTGLKLFNPVSNSNVVLMELSTDAITFKDTSGNVQATFGANGAIQSGNYSRGSAGTKFAAGGTKIDLINGEILTKYFRLSQGVETGVPAGAYIYGTVEAIDGKIGSNSTNYWYIGNYTDYNQSQSAAIKSYGSAFIQLGSSSTWRLATNRIHSAWNDDGGGTSGLLHYPNYSSKYWDSGLHLPTSSTDKFLYVRNAPNTEDLENLQNDLDDLGYDYWKYQFYVNGSGSIYARNFYVLDDNGNTTQIGGTDGVYLLKAGGTMTGSITMSNGGKFIGDLQGNADTATNASKVNNLTVQTAVPANAVFTDEKVTQTATTTSSAYELLFSGTADNTTRTEGARKTSTLTYNPSTKALVTGGTVNGYTLAAAAAKGVVTTLDTSANLPTASAVSTALGNYLPLTGGNVTGAVSFGSSVSSVSASIVDLVVTGAASITNNLAVNTINGVTVGASPKFTDTNYYHTTGSWSGLTYTATANGGAGALAFTIPTGTTSSTVLRGDHTYTTTIATSSGANQLTMAANTRYVLTAGGTTFVFTTPPDSNTWRGIQDNLTSSTNTTESLSAKQGYLLANGSARDNTKLPLTGGVVTGGVTFEDSVDIVDLTAGSLIVNGAGRFTDGLYGNLTGNVSGNASTATNVAWSGITSKPATLSGYGITDGVKFYGNLTSLGSGTPAAATKTYWTDNVSDKSVGAAYNSSGAEYSILFGKGTTGYGSILKYGYTDRYLYILRRYASNWQSDDWEKIDAGYADSAGSAGSASSATKATQDSDGNAINTTYLKLSGGNMTGVNGIQFPTTNDTTRTGHFISAGGGYGTGSGKNGMKIISCETAEGNAAGLGQDLTGHSNETTLVGIKTSSAGRISFAFHALSTITTYDEVGYFDYQGNMGVSGNLTVSGGTVTATNFTGNAATATKATKANITTTANHLALYSDTSGTFADSGIANGSVTTKITLSGTDYSASSNTIAITQANLQNAVQDTNLLLMTAAERTKLASIAVSEGGSIDFSGVTATAPLTATVNQTTKAVNLTHNTSGVTTGTYRSVTVDSYGHVTAGTNPTTLSGYGITDALPLAGGTMTGGVTFVGNQSSAWNDVGIKFTNGSRIGENSSGEIGIYSPSKLYLRPSSSTGASSDGILIDSDGLYPSNNNTESLGTSSNKWANVYATTFTGDLSGNAASATNATTASKLGSSNLGSATKPIYLAAGVATEANTYAGGTAVTLNGSSKAANTASFYAPATAGTSGQVLTSSGGAPGWTNQSSLSVGSATNATNATNDSDGNQIKTTYLKLSGGTMTGPLKWTSSTALPQQTGTLEYILGVDAFASGGTTKWKTASDVTVGYAINATNATNATNAVNATKATQDGDGNTIKTTYLKLTGGNITGAVSFGSSVSINSLSVADMVCTGAASFTNGLNGNLTGNVTGNLTGNVTGVVLGTNSAANPSGALLQSGAGRADTSPSGDTWIYWDTLGGTSSYWGIRHNQAANTIGFYGGGTQRALIYLAESKITATSFDGKATSAGVADQISALNANDNASSTETWRKVWFSYNDGVTGRPALSDSFAYQTSTNTLKAPHFTAEHVINGDGEYRVTYGSTVDMALMIGSTNTNHGIWDYKANKWMIYADGSGNVTVNGNAATATTASSATSATTSLKTGDGNMLLYAHNSNEVNFGGTNNSATIFIGYRAVDSKPIPSTFIFGGSSGSANIKAASFNGFTIGKSVPNNAVFTDTYVNQSASTTSEWRKVLLHYNSNTSKDAAVQNSTNVVYGAVGVEVQPSTGTLKANASQIKHWNLSEDSTTGALVFSYVS